MRNMALKDAVAYSNKMVAKKCGDGLMKDVMKVCIHWFLKVAYGEGYMLCQEDDEQEVDTQGDLFAKELGPEDVDAAN